MDEMGVVSESAQEKFESIEHAVIALEQLDLCALSDDPCAMAEAMILRQYALDYLKSHPLSAVSEPRRGALRQRLEAVQASDAEAMQLLREARTQVGGQLDNLVSGRAAVRGYGGLYAADTTSQTGVKRQG
jgi:hypothetical protein